MLGGEVNKMSNRIGSTVKSVRDGLVFAIMCTLGWVLGWIGYRLVTHQHINLEGYVWSGHGIFWLFIGLPAMFFVKQLTLRAHRRRPLT